MAAHKQKELEEAKVRGDGAKAKVRRLLERGLPKLSKANGPVGAMERLAEWKEERRDALHALQFWSDVCERVSAEWEDALETGLAARQRLRALQEAHEEQQTH